MRKINHKKLIISISTMLSLFAPVSATVMATENLNYELNQQEKNPIKKVAQQTSNKASPKTKSNDVISDVVNMSNFYAGTNVSNAPKGGTILIKVFAFSTTDHAMILPRFYIVLPKGTSAVGGLEGVQDAINAYIEARNVHGSLTVKQLANTDNEREAYQVTPAKGTYVDKQAGNFVSADIPVEISQTDHDLQEIVIDANQMDQIADDVLYVGAGNGNDIQFDGALYAYPVSLASHIGIKGGQDEVVRSIVLKGNRVEVPLYSPQVKDTYNIVDASDGNKLLKTITKQGEVSSSYSRAGLIDNLQKLGLDETIYAQDSMQIDSGELSGSAILTVPDETITTDKNRVYTGHTYTVSVKQRAAPITIKYFDETGQSIGQSQIIQGYIGDKYDASIPEYKKTISGYQLIKLPENVNGVFGKKPVTVIYQYTKVAMNTSSNDVTPKIIEDIIKFNEFQKTMANQKDELKNGSTAKQKKAVKDDRYTLTVRYVDSSGKKIAKDDIITGKKGIQYSVRAKKIKGYRLKSQSARSKGVFGEVNVYIYEYSKTDLRKSKKTLEAYLYLDKKSLS